MTQKPCPSLLAIRKAILPLINEFPTNNTSIWLAPEELHERLLLTGVLKSLRLNMVLSSLRLYNSGEAFMAKTKYGDTTYYISEVAHLGDTRNSLRVSTLNTYMSAMFHTISLFL